MTDLAPHLSAFLRQHLPRVCNASRHTVASYADSFMLLVRFAAERLDIRPSEIAVEHLTPELILDFLDHLEQQRRNSVGTRNVRLAAIKSFFRYLEYRVAACLEQARQVHAIPLKRRDEPMVNHLDRDEVQALLDAPDPGTPTGLRDRAMLHLTAAARKVPPLASKRITPHTLRHACALHTLEATGDIRKVSLWLGHASLRSTEIYLRSDPIGKLQILADRLPPSIRRGSFPNVPDRLISILLDARAVQ